jgi:hypothetical protein
MYLMFIVSILLDSFNSIHLYNPFLDPLPPFCASSATITITTPHLLRFHHSAREKIHRRRMIVLVCVCCTRVHWIMHPIKLIPHHDATPTTPEQNPLLDAVLATDECWSSIGDGRRK